VIEGRLRSRDAFGRRELYAVETEAEAFTGESLCLVVRRRGHYGKVEGWRPAEIVERQHVRGDDPSEIGEARAELESLAELRSQAAWDCDERHGDPADCDPRAPCAGSARRCSTPSNAGSAPVIEGIASSSACVCGITADGSTDRSPRRPFTA
jgi:hypothetical protein